VLFARERWNHNIHYHSLVLGAIPAGCSNALDVGCGEGILARDLRQRVASVVAIDLHEPSIQLAREHNASGIEYVLGDVLTYPLEPESFDLVASIATLHHMDAATGLRRMAELVRPGGMLVVVGLARSGAPGDHAWDALGVISTRLHRLTKTHWEHSAPVVWPPPDSYAQTRRLANEILPGVRYRRHVLFRYSLTWSKPYKR
jgi:2-polyprenyl-3-methyl-5-hydroxy-6-metoxy-1,4-benzoquinol methylase